LNFESRGLWLRGLRLPIPHALLPKSEWKERPTDKGWTFDGSISLPWPIGRLMRYHGHFQPCYDQITSRHHRGRAIVAGGTAMLGKYICKSLKAHGFEVVVLTRNRVTPHGPHVDRYVAWDGTAATSHQWEELIDMNTVIINLAGENPGASRWDARTRNKIVESRLQTIGACTKAIEMASARGQPPISFIQASAVGIVGDRPGELLSDDCQLPTNLPPASRATGSEFRAACCVEMEAAARGASKHTNVCLMRIGIALAQEGGLLPYLDLASAMRASRLGSGDQVIPWVHAADVGEAFAHVAMEPESFVGSVNLVAPHAATNQEMFSALAAVRGRALCILPVPAWSLKMAIGDSACMLLDSQRLVPDRLLQCGFKFQFPKLEPALRACL
jgi:uncharacterized protein (TIGR01777 family)